MIIGARQFDFSGDLDDPLFVSLPGFSKSHRPLYAFLARLSRTAVCYDIGANIGLTSAAIASHVESGSLFAFEPSPANAAHLRKNLARNSLVNAVVVQTALGAHEGIVEFVLPSAGANSHVLRQADTGGQRTTSVTVKTLDGWRAATQSPLPDFIKIDVEGFEPEVLQGAASTICEAKAPIYLEFNSLSLITEARCSPLAFAEYLWRHFLVSRLAVDGSETPIDEAYAFTIDNLTARGMVEDIMLRLKPGVQPGELMAGWPPAR